jgi:hypothetical protein
MSVQKNNGFVYFNILISIVAGIEKKVWIDWNKNNSNLLLYI